MLCIIEMETESDSNLTQTRLDSSTRLRLTVMFLAEAFMHENLWQNDNIMFLIFSYFQLPLDDLFLFRCLQKRWCYVLKFSQLFDKIVVLQQLNCHFFQNVSMWRGLIAERKVFDCFQGKTVTLKSRIPRNTIFSYMERAKCCL